MEIKCAHDALVDIASLKLHPRNRNAHPMTQLLQLAKILKYTGWRSPVIVSKLTGYVVAGHGRIEAAKINEWDKVPVNYQEFENEAQEFAHLTADNAISLQAELDKEQIKLDAADFTDLDDEMLGIEMFENEPINKIQIEPIEEVNEKSQNDQFLLEVLCTSDLEQDDLYREMQDRGFIVRKK